MTGGRRQAIDGVYSHVIGALELNFNQGGWYRIFNFNLIYNFTSGRHACPHAHAAVPGGPTVVESDTNYLLCKLFGRAQINFTIN